MTFLTRSSIIFLPHFKEAQFYLIDLRNIQNIEVTQAKMFLDEEALVRANKQIFLEDRQKRILIYAFLRFYLSDLTEQKISKIRLFRNSCDKPYIKGTPIHFNISHTKRYAILAFHPHFPIGIDIEQVRDIPSILEMADLFMHHHEKRRMLDSKDMIGYFFSLWCSKEAFLKARGISFDQLRNWSLDTDLSCNENQSIPLKHNIYLYRNMIELHKLAVCIDVGKSIRGESEGDKKETLSKQTDLTTTGLKGDPRRI